MKYLRVTNHERHQHYKNRNPPWIKLHRSCLDSYRFTQLPDASKWQALGIALLASQTDNHVPADPAWLKSALHSTCKVDVAALIEAGFVHYCEDGAVCKQCASNALARDASELSLPEEVETEESREDPKPPARQGSRRARFEEFWEHYPSKKGKIAAESSFARAEKKGMPEMPAVLAALEKQKKSRQWQRGVIPNPATWLNQGRWADEVPEEGSDKDEGWYVVAK